MSEQTAKRGECLRCVRCGREGEDVLRARVGYLGAKSSVAAYCQRCQWRLVAERLHVRGEDDD